jgi:hypothetical protein
VLLPLAAGIVLGGVNVALRQFIPIDAAVAAFIQSQGAEKQIAPELAGAILGYFSGGISPGLRSATPESARSIDYVAPASATLRTPR